MIYNFISILKKKKNNYRMIIISFYKEMSLDLNQISLLKLKHFMNGFI